MNLELVRAGLAWHYKKYNDSEVLAAAERQARAARRGLWSQPDPIPPWDWPRGVRGVQRGAVDAPYHGNTSSHVFHKPSCRYFNCKNCTRRFSSREAAIASGFRPCGVCRP